MVTTTTPNRGLTYPGHGEAVNSWDTPLNTNFDMIDKGLGGTYNIHLGAYGATTFNSTNCTAASTVATLTLPSTLASNSHLTIDGTISGNLTVNYPANLGGQFVVSNGTTGAFSLTIASAGGGPGTYEIAQGGSNTIGSDGTEIFDPDSNETASALPTYLGDPNTNVAGIAGAVNGALTDALWDPNDHQMWVCTATGTALTAVWSKLTYPGFNSALNVGLSVGHTGGNLLTVALKNAAGNDPSAASPVTVSFQTVAAGATTGTTTTLLITSALSMNSNALGATLETTTNVPFRFWIAIFNNAGTPVLAIRNCSTTRGTYTLAEYGVASTAGISAGATSANTWYTPNGISLANCAFRLIGYCEYTSGLAVPGTYSTDPNNVVIYGPGIKLPGDIVQSLYNSSGTYSAGVCNGWTLFPGTAPTIAQGRSLISQSIVPTSKINRLRISTQAAFYTNVQIWGAFGIVDTTNAAIRTVTETIMNGNIIGNACTSYYETVANTVASIQYDAYGWVQSGNNAYLNGVGGTTYGGGNACTFIKIEEIMG